MSNAIQLENEADHKRTLTIETEIITETGWKPPDREKFVTYPAVELVDAIRERLREEGIAFE